MNQNFTQEMLQTLVTSRQALLENLAIESQQLREVIRDSSAVGDVIDVAASSIDASLLESAGTRDLSRLKMVEAALGRINSGHYGLCVRCGETIDQSRLRAMPYAPFCINCQNRTEQRKRKK